MRIGVIIILVGILSLMAVIGANSSPQLPRVCKAMEASDGVACYSYKAYALR